MTALLLSLGAAALWGTADFFGGLSARRLPVLAVTVWSQAAGLVTILVVALATGAAASGAGLAWGAAAGVVGSLALTVFYAALAAGTMSIVAPLSALGALVPVAVALAGGERLAALTWAGLALALGGAVLAARQPPQAAPATAVPGAGAPAMGAGPARAALTPRVLGLALGAAAGLGIVLTLLQQGAQAEGSSGLTATAASRGVSVVLTLAAVAALRAPTALPRGRRTAVLAVGVADTGANGLFAVASDAGQDALVAVLSSLYPVVTVLLARALLAERITRPQGVGVGIALAGVVLASAS